MIAPTGVTAPQAGVIATSPVMAPDAAPTPVTWPSLIFSTAIQASVAAQVATNVVTMTMAAELPAASAEPPLNAYQPAHSRPAPSSVSGTLCGLRSLPQPADLPSTIATASAAAPALMCTAVPPAKSMALQAVGDPAADGVLGHHAVEREHPVRDREVHQHRPHRGEDHPGAELHPVGHRTRDQRDGDRREQRLEQREQRDR